MIAPLPFLGKASANWYAVAARDEGAASIWALLV